MKNVVEEVNKEILSDSKKQVNIVKYAAIVGVLFLLVDIVLVSFSIMSPHTLWVTIPLVYVVRAQIIKYQLSRMTHNFTQELLNSFNEPNK